MERTSGKHRLRLPAGGILIPRNKRGDYPKMGVEKIGMLKILREWVDFFLLDSKNVWDNPNTGR